MTQSREEMTPPEIRVLVLIAAILLILVIILMTSCVKQETIKPVYFTYEIDHRYYQYVNESKQLIDVYDTCYIVFPNVDGTFFLNGQKINTLCTTPPKPHYNLCDARRGDTISVDYPLSGIIEYMEVLE